MHLAISFALAGLGLGLLGGWLFSAIVPQEEFMMFLGGTVCLMSSGTLGGLAGFMFGIAQVKHGN